MTIASLMICGLPRILGGRLALSGYDGVWDPVESLPVELRGCFTDDLGNEAPEYGGFLQLVDSGVLAKLHQYGLFACFRDVAETWIEHTNSNPPSHGYKWLSAQRIGWDVACGNGWRSASTDGSFPFDPFTGVADEDAIVNQFGLISDEQSSLRYCDLSDRVSPSNAPWFPVGIRVDDDSLARLDRYLHGRNGHMVRTPNTY